MADTPCLFDFEKIRRNRAFAMKHITGHDFLFSRAANRVTDNLRDINRDFQDVLIVGWRGAGIVADYFDGKANVTVCDVEIAPDGVRTDHEIPVFDAGTFDCVIAMPYVHTVNDVPGFLAQVKSFLRPDGVFLCSLFGGQSLQELRQSIMSAELQYTGGASQHIHPMIDHYQLAGLMQRAGFSLPVVDYDRLNVSYATLETLYADLRSMGESNALSDRKRGIKDFKDIIEKQYRKSFYNNGFDATFDILHAIGWAPHESQQKPAKRGSGQVSLTEIL